MHDVHITFELLCAVDDGERNPTDLSDIALAHLARLCPVCRANLKAWIAKVTEGSRATTYNAAFEHALAAAERAADRMKREWHKVEPRVAALLALPASERLEAIQREPLEFRGPVLGELLIDESRTRMPGRPREALALAELAMAVLQHSELSSLVVELYARATSHVANALRVCGHLPDASRLFATVRFLLRQLGGGDRLVRAEIDCLEGSLLRDQRRFEDSVTLLLRAVHTCEARGLPSLAGRTRLTLGSVYHEIGDPLAAAQQAEEALELLDPEVDAGLCMLARHNLADCWCELGRFEEAQELVAETKRSQRLDQLTTLRASWIEGKIAHRMGDLTEAESHFLAARHGFLHHGIAFDAALAALDLAVLYLEEGRTAEVKELAAEMAAVFSTQEVHREATAALMLFRDAADLERLSRALILDLATYLQRARRDPSFAYQPTS